LDLSPLVSSQAIEVNGIAVKRLVKDTDNEQGMVSTTLSVLSKLLEDIYVVGDIPSRVLKSLPQLVDDDQQPTITYGSPTNIRKSVQPTK
jgi:hypothetical protein